ncbi:MAG: YdiU family protein [Defluviitaleaceae bacterium]|nr:YdiU family protein [Defluviitaleaceae bacterium]
MQNEGWNLENTYAALPEIFYQNQEPEGAVSPEIVIFNQPLAKELGLNPANISPDIFAGSRLPCGANPISQAYAGYQFGHFAMLGDGRAVLLGEQITPKGDRFDIQLKGSGRTAFSRGGDGRAALSPMLREYIISEAMYFLGIPTTRSLAVATTGVDVMREKTLQGAILTRVASSHIRVGTFNYISAFGTKDDLRKLADYSIWRHFPDLENKENKYILFLQEVAKRQGSLIASWQLVGFIHGVMNTDNMSISGETIDYGPCAFMDTYDPGTVFSSIDKLGRYAYDNQPKIGAWNLARLAEAVMPLFDGSESEVIEQAKGSIAQYWGSYNKNWIAGMRNKVGILGEEPTDTEMMAELLDLMAKNKLDYTATFRSLPSAQKSPPLIDWHKKWQSRLKNQDENIMLKHNPAAIPRNHHVEEALASAEQGDLSEMHNLLAALSKPFEDSQTYSQPPKHANCGYKTFCGT